MTQLMDDKQRAFIRKADMLSKLPLSEAFRVLTEEMEVKRQRMEKHLMVRVMAEGMSGEAIEKQAWYDRGFVAGMRYAVVDVPEGAQRKLSQRAPSSEENEEVLDQWA